MTPKPPERRTVRKVEDGSVVRLADGRVGVLSRGDAACTVELAGGLLARVAPSDEVEVVKTPRELALDFLHPLNRGEHGSFTSVEIFRLLEEALATLPDPPSEGAADGEERVFVSFPDDTLRRFFGVVEDGGGAFVARLSVSLSRPQLERLMRLLPHTPVCDYTTLYPPFPLAGGGSITRCGRCGRSGRLRVVQAGEAAVVHVERLGGGAGEWVDFCPVAT